MTSWQEQMAAKLTEALQGTFNARMGPTTLAPAQEQTRKRDGFQLQQLASKLIGRAAERGLEIKGNDAMFRQLDGGNTALQVAIASVQANYVFKADDKPKLIREARTIDEMRADRRLGSFRFRLPKVYAIHDEAPPYAYVMEWYDERVYPSIKEIFFAREREPSPEEAEEIVAHAIEALHEAYRNSKDERMQVRMMGEAYYQRLQDNLEKAAEHPDFSSMQLDINNETTRPWKDLLKLLRDRRRHLQQLAAPFVTIVHGDPNPGNILVKREGHRIEDIKFIDVKDWRYGDYVFDIAKLSHFLLFTGPVEQLKAYDIEVVDRASGLLTLKYSLREYEYVTRAVKRIEKEAAAIADALGDQNWNLRYKLAMASNLLGLIPGRLQERREDESRILYAEGMKYLEIFCREFEAMVMTGNN